MFGVEGNHAVLLFGGERLDLLGGYAGIDAAGIALLVREDKGAGGDDGAAVHDGVVEQGGTHPDQTVVFDTGAVNGGVVADRNVVAQFDYRFLVEGVQYGAVLDVDAIAEADGVNVAAKDGAVPDGAVVAHRDVADQGGGFGQKTVVADCGGDAFQGADQCHIVSIVLGFVGVGGGV